MLVDLFLTVYANNVNTFLQKGGFLDIKRP